MHSKLELLELLRAHDIRLRKRLGQNYLIDMRLARRLIARCELRRTDTVLEVGAGLGALTDLLAEAAGRVIALEVDRAVAEALRQRMPPLPNVEVRQEDILTVEPQAFEGCTIVGALPYQISSPILVRLCEQALRFPRAYVSLQREVVERLAARPGTAAYGRLSVLVQYHFEVETLARMPRSAFFPVPTVDSLWIRLTSRPHPVVQVRDLARFFDVVRVAFGQRRKTLVNCLTQLEAAHLRREAAVALLARAGLPADIRGERLSIPQFALLANALSDS